MFGTLTNPIVGGAQTGFTSPTYTYTVDSEPHSHAEQVAITTLGGTQGSASAHSVASPFTCTVERPANLRLVGAPHPVSGVLGSVPNNVYKVRTRKGAVPLSGQAARMAKAETSFSIPAGCDTASPDDLLAMISAHIGVLNDLSVEIGGTVKTGILGA